MWWVIPVAFKIVKKTLFLGLNWCTIDVGYKPNKSSGKGKKYDEIRISEEN